MPENEKTVSELYLLIIDQHGAIIIGRKAVVVGALRPDRAFVFFVIVDKFLDKTKHMV